MGWTQKDTRVFVVPEIVFMVTNITPWVRAPGEPHALYYKELAGNCMSSYRYHLPSAVSSARSRNLTHKVQAALSPRHGSTVAGLGKFC